MDIFSPVKLIVKGNWTLSNQAAWPARQDGVLSRVHLMGKGVKLERVLQSTDKFSGHRT